MSGEHISDGMLIAGGVLIVGGDGRVLCAGCEARSGAGVCLPMRSALASSSVDIIGALGEGDMSGEHISGGMLIAGGDGRVLCAG